MSHLSGDSPGVNEMVPGIRDVDWSLFDAILFTDLGDTHHFDETRPEEKLTALTNLLSRAWRESIPRLNKIKISARWWNSELDKARVGKVLSLRRWKRLRKRFGEDNPTVIMAHRRFIESRTSYVNMVMYFKRKSWLDCVNLASESDPWGRTYKIVMKNKPVTPMMIMNVDDLEVTDPIEIAMCMLNGLLPDD